MPDNKKKITDPALLSQLNSGTEDESTDNGVRIDSPKLSQDIADIESSGGDYTARNPSSSATGKYQFLWNTFGDSIKKVTGVKNQKEFLDSPKAQEEFFNYHVENNLKPSVERIKEYNKQGYSDEQLAKLVHFKGEQGAIDFLSSGADATKKHNISIPDYIGEPEGQKKKVVDPDVLAQLNQSTPQPQQATQPPADNNFTKMDTITGLPVFPATQQPTATTVQQPAEQTQQPTKLPNEDWQHPQAVVSGAPQPEGAAQGISPQTGAPINIPQQPAEKPDPQTETANAAITLHSDLSDAINSGHFSEYKGDAMPNALNAMSNPHGDPAFTGEVVKQRLLQIESQKAQEIKSAKPGTYIKDIEDKYNAKEKQIQDAAKHITSLQLAYQEYNKKIAADQSGVTQIPGETAPIQYTETPKLDKPGEEPLNAQQAIQEQRKAERNQPFDAVAIGLKQQALLGDKTAQDDLAKYNNGQVIDPDRKVNYQYAGLTTLQKGSQNAAASNQPEVAKVLGENSDNIGERLEKDNPGFYKKLWGNQIGSYLWKNVDNPLYGTIFSRPKLTPEEVVKYGKEAGLTNDQIKQLTPEDVPTAASWYGKFAQSAFNTLLLKNEKSSGGKFFTGDMPTEQISPDMSHPVDNWKGITGEVASGAGMVAGFMAQGGIMGEALKGAEILGDVAANAKRYEQVANMLPLAASNYNQAYQSSKEVIGDKPEDEGKRLLYATIDGTLSTALMSIDPATALGKEALMGKEGKGIVDILKNTPPEKLNAEELKPALYKWFEEKAKGAGVTAQHLASQSFIMGANQAVENITNMIFDPEHRHGIMDNVGSAALQGGVAMLLPSVFAGIQGARKVTPLNSDIAFDVALNQNKYKDQVTSLLNSGKITPEEAKQTQQNIDLMGNIVKQTPKTNSDGQPLTPEQFKEYAYNLYQEQNLNKQLESLNKGFELTKMEPDKAQIDPLKQKITELQKRRNDIYGTAGQDIPKPEAPPLAPPEPATPPKEQEPVPEEDKINLGELIGRKVLYHGEPATLATDEGGEVTVTNKDGKSFVLGQIGKVGEESAKEHGIEEISTIKGGPSVVKINDAGNYEIRGKEYNLPEEHTDNPLGAINYHNEPGKKGIPVSVTLRDQNGKPRTFRGDVAEDLMYQLHLQKLDKDNSHADYEQFINSDAAANQKANEAADIQSTQKDAGGTYGEIPVTEEAAKKPSEKLGETEKKDITLSPTEEEPQKTTDYGKDETGYEATSKERRQETGIQEREDNKGRQETGRESRILTPTEGPSGEQKEPVAKQPQPTATKEPRKRRALKPEIEPSTEKVGDIPIISSHEMRTIDYGVAEGKDAKSTDPLLDKAAKENPDKPIDHLLTDQTKGESPNDFAKRIGSQISEYTKPETEGGLPHNALLNTHSNVIKLLLAAYDKAKGVFDFNKPTLIDDYTKKHAEFDKVYDFKIKDPDGKERTLQVTRHGETEANLADKQRTPDDKLTNVGRSDAKDIAAELKEKDAIPPVIVSSDLDRSQETAKIIAKELSTEPKKEKRSLKPETDATKISSRKRQEGVPKGSEPEHARTNAPREQTPEPKTEGSHRPERGTEKKEVTPTSTEEVIPEEKPIAAPTDERSVATVPESEKETPATKEKQPEILQKKIDKLNSLTEEHDDLNFQKEELEDKMQNALAKSKLDPEEVDALEKQISEIESAIKQKAEDIQKKNREIEIQKGYSKGADNIRKIGKNITKGSGGMVGTFPGLSPKSVGEIFNKVADLYEKFDNIHIATLKALEWAKDRFKDEKGISLVKEEHIKELLSPHVQPLRDEPIIKNADHLQAAKDWLNDIENGDITYNEARKEIMESEGVYDKTKGNVLNYIDWHLKDRDIHNGVTLREPDEKANVISDYQLQHSDHITRMLSGETIEDITGEKALNPQEKEALSLELSLMDSQKMVALMKYHHGTDPVDWGGKMIDQIDKLPEGDTQKRVSATIGLMDELRKERNKLEYELSKLPPEETERRAQINRTLSEIPKLISRAEYTYQTTQSNASATLNRGRTMRELFTGEYAINKHTDQVLGKEKIAEKQEVQKQEAKTDIPDKVAKEGVIRKGEEADKEIEQAEKQQKVAAEKKVAEKKKSKNVIEKLKKVADKKTEIDKNRITEMRKEAERKMGGSPDKFLEQLRDKIKKSPC